MNTMWPKSNPAILKLNKDVRNGSVELAVVFSV